MYAFFVVDWHITMPCQSKKLYTEILKRNFNFGNKKDGLIIIADILPIICEIFF